MKQVGVPGDPNLTAVRIAANFLGELRESVVFTGGCAAGLLITTPRAQMIRATQDVDVVVELVTTREYHNFERDLRSRGFINDQPPDAPICRWRRESLILDAMPTNPDILGFGNRWYPLAVKTAERVRLPGDTAIRLIAAPVFLATKLEAFHGRGNNDFLASHDLEDVLAVVDGRGDLIDELHGHDPDLRAFLSHEFSFLLSQPDFLAAMPGYLPADSASQGRLPFLMERISQIANRLET